MFINLHHSSNMASAHQCCFARLLGQPQARSHDCLLNWDFTLVSASQHQHDEIFLPLSRGFQRVPEGSSRLRRCCCCSIFRPAGILSVPQYLWNVCRRLLRGVLKPFSEQAGLSSKPSNLQIGSVHFDSETGNFPFKSLRLWLPQLDQQR